MTQKIPEAELRRQKVESLKQRGIDPYPAVSARTISVQGFLDAFDDLEGEKQDEVLAGRIRLKRGHGKILFSQLEDGSVRVQVVVAADEIDEEQFSFANEMIDVGDIVEVTGHPFVTKKGERSVLAKKLVMLTKAVQPLPDKWKGIQDEETRYRKRYVDMLMTPELREMFRKKARFWQAMREFLIGEGFLEVETPVLESTPGGADAEPFTTHHNALDIDLYLRISMGELWQKRLMVGGFEKTFEIGRQFRNEGLSPEHLQDYTQMEFYYGYADYRLGMELVERMYKYVIQEAFGTLQFHIRGFDIDLSQSWGKLDYSEAIKSATGLEIATASDAELKTAAESMGVKVDQMIGRGRIVDSIWKQVRKGVAGPVFLIDHPVEVSPLAKRHPDNPNVVERFQVILAGSEIGNGYSELNDPVDQSGRFEEQAALREAGDPEAQMHDRDFVEALEYAMPPTCGFGVSERLFSFLMDKPIKECVMFPLLRPKQDGDQRVEAVSVADDESLKQFSAGISREEAKDLVFAEVKDHNLRRHMLATEIIMKALAERFGAASPQEWGIAGLLHDVDYESCSAEEHSLVGAALLEERGVHKLVVDAVREHNYHHGLTPTTMLSKAMMSLEQLTGLIVACALVRPDKKITSVTLKSVKKKLKDKAFARGVDRAMIHRSEELLGLSLDEALEICLAAMQADAESLGLN